MPFSSAGLTCSNSDTAYHFLSTATLLLRCALETESDVMASSCITSARGLIERLRRAKQEDEWDLGDICLLQCEGILSRMISNRDNGLSPPRFQSNSLVPSPNQQQEDAITPPVNSNRSVNRVERGTTEIIQGWKCNEPEGYAGNGIGIFSPPLLGAFELGDRWNTQIPDLWEMLRFEEADFGNPSVPTAQNLP